MSDSNRVRVVLGPETTFGTAVATTGYTMLVTGQSLTPQIGYQSSRLLRSDRNVQDMVRMSLSAGGELPTELLFDDPTATPGAFWRLLRSTLRYDSETAADTFASATATNNAKTVTGASIESGLSLGDIVRLRLVAGGALVGYYRVTVLGSDSITVDAPSNFTGQNVEVERGLRIKNGTDNTGANLHSYTIEIGRMDLGGGTGLFEVFTGMTPDTFSLRISDGSSMTAGFTFAGKQMASTGTSTTFAGSIVAAPTTGVMNCIDNIPTLYVAGATYAAKDLSFTIANNCAPRTQIGSLGAQSVRDGVCSVTGQVRAYFSSHTELAKFIADTTSDILLVTQDTAGNAYSWSFPKIKWSAANVATSGMNEDDFVTLDFTAIYNSNEASSIVVEAWQN